MCAMNESGAILEFIKKARQPPSRLIMNLLKKKTADYYAKKAYIQK